MALTDIVFDDNNSAAAARGDIGSAVDSLSPQMSHRLLLAVPVIADVKIGVQYGQQGTELTGTYVGGGGGGNTYSRGRVVNA